MQSQNTEQNQQEIISQPQDSSTLNLTALQPPDRKLSRFSVTKTSVPEDIVLPAKDNIPTTIIEQVKFLIFFLHFASHKAHFTILGLCLQCRVFYSVKYT